MYLDFKEKTLTYPICSACPAPATIAPPPPAPASVSLMATVSIHVHFVLFARVEMFLNAEFYRTESQ